MSRADQEEWFDDLLEERYPYPPDAPDVELFPEDPGPGVDEPDHEDPGGETEDAGEGESGAPAGDQGPEAGPPVHDGDQEGSAEPGPGSGGGQDEDADGGEAPGAGEGERPFDDCGWLETSCHISSWFYDLVESALNPLFGWLGEQAFTTPVPTGGVEGLWSGVSLTANALYVLLVLAGGLIVMGHETLQQRYPVGEILPGLVLGFIASNLSLWVARELIIASNGIAMGIAADGIDPARAATQLNERMDTVLMEAVVFTLLLVVVVVVLFVLWMLVEIVRVVMTICLVILAPLLLMFHALPHTQRLAALWWRLMAALLAIPILQSLMFIAFMRLFFQGEMAIIAGMSPGEDGEVDSMELYSSIALFLVMFYVQLRIPFWCFKLVWQPTLGASPLVTAAKTAATMLLLRRVVTRTPKAAPAAAGRTTHPVPPPAPPRVTVQPLAPVRGTIAPAPARALAGGAAPGPGAPWPHPPPHRPPGPRPHGAARSRLALGDGAYPAEEGGQTALVPRPSAPTSPAAPRRWRQGVLPTPPPLRMPGRRATQRLGDLVDEAGAPPVGRVGQVKGQRPLFPSPRRRWAQRRLSFPT